MYPKNNKLTYRLNDEQKMVKTRVGQINHVVQGQVEQKRAFTIVTDKQKLNVAKDDGSNTIPINNESLSTESLHTYGAEEEWPSIEQLEALIRGEHEHGATRQAPHNYEQLELPLQFRADEQAPSTPSVDNNPVTSYIEDKQEVLREEELIHYPFHDEMKAKSHVEDAVALDDMKAMQWHSSALSSPKSFDISVSWTKIATAVMSSILTGVLIGYVLLLAVYGVKVWPVNLISEQLATSGTSPAAEATKQQTVLQVSDLVDDDLKEASVSVKTAEAEETPVLDVSEPIVIQPVQTFTYTALQAGVFSKDDTKQAMIDTLKAKGYPATSIRSLDGKIVVFAGLASSQQATYQMNHMSGIELYRKSFSINVPYLSENALQDEQLQQWMFNVHDLLQSYMKMSEAQFEQSSVSKIYAESYSLLQEKYKSFMSETTTLKSSITEEDLLKFIAMHETEMTNIQNEFATYQEKPSLKSLFSIEQYVLTIIGNQVEWFEK